jgi:hypothetical protein
MEEDEYNEEYFEELRLFEVWILNQQEEEEKTE